MRPTIFHPFAFAMLAILTFALVGAVPAPVRAQAPGAGTAGPEAGAAGPEADATQAPAAARPTPPEGFEPVSGPAAAQTAVEAPPLVIGAYLFIWGAILAYLVVLWQRQRRLNAELEGLARRLRRAVE